MDTKNEPAPKTPADTANMNKSPISAGPTMIRLPNGQYIRTAAGVTPNQNGRALTPNGR